MLAAALGLLDEVGLDALTTRRLAQRLGVQPGALYRHFASKRELLGAMVRHLMPVPDGDVELPDDWAALLTAAAQQTRAAMLSHRDGARLLATYIEPADEKSQFVWRRMIDTVVSGGIAEADAYTAVDTLFAYVNGFTMEEQARDPYPPQPAHRAVRDEAFRRGLGLIVNGIRASQPAAADR